MSTAGGASTKEPVCPKRLWVQLTISDDEVIGADQELPAGLRVHLKRCPSCRELADRMLATSAGLRELGGQEPADSLHERAREMALSAVAEGHEPSVPVLKLSDVDLMGEAAIIDSPLRGFRWMPAAVAAALLLVVAIGWSFRSSEPRQSGSVVVEPRQPGNAHVYEGPTEWAPSEGVAEVPEDSESSGFAERPAEAEPTSRPHGFARLRWRERDGEMEVVLPDESSGAQPAFFQAPVRRNEESIISRLIDSSKEVLFTTPSADER